MTSLRHLLPIAAVASTLLVAAVPASAAPLPMAAKQGKCPTAVERGLKVIKGGVTHKAEVVGERLILISADGRSAPAADGTYLKPDGEKIVVKDGKIVKGASAKGG
jgi:hypothetical protein